MTNSHFTRGALVASLAGALVMVACGAPATDGANENDEESIATTTASALTTCSGYNATTGAKLAAQGATREGDRSQSACYAYVKTHVQAATGVNIHTALPAAYQNGAYQFAQWADANPTALSNLGFAKINPGTNPPPKGSILVWNRGVCGYSKKWGHIEIVENDTGTRACSDFCGRVKTGCGTPEVYMPITPGANPTSVCASDAGATPDASDASAPKADSCQGRADGWYCSEETTYSAYDCKSGSIASGWQCVNGQLCEKSGSGDQAVMSGQYPACGGGQ